MNDIIHSSVAMLAILTLSTTKSVCCLNVNLCTTMTACVGSAQWGTKTKAHCYSDCIIIHCYSDGIIVHRPRAIKMVRIKCSEFLIIVLRLFPSHGCYYRRVD